MRGLLATSGFPHSFWILVSRGIVRYKFTNINAANDLGLEREI
ncbi:hypothetical protein [Novipirellula caenicola]